MFMYREDYYNEMCNRPNICEVAVAKNRGGPTGTADLYWNGKVTKFSNLQREPISF